jgi:hypothetical protein
MEEIFELIQNAESGVLPATEVEINRMIVTIQSYEGLARMVEILSRPEAINPHVEIHGLVRQFKKP